MTNKINGQYIYAEIQYVIIETSNNIFGFDFLTKPKIENFIKFDNVQIIPYPGYNLDDETNNYPVCFFEFILNDKILFEKRQYVQLIDVLGEVGGFMEIINSFFNWICSFVVDFLYEITFTNNLFSFNLKKKLIIIKKDKISKISEFIIKEEIKEEQISSFNFEKKKKKLLITGNNTVVNNRSKTNNILETNPIQKEMEIEDNHSDIIKFRYIFKGEDFSNLKKKDKNDEDTEDKNYIINKIDLKLLLIPLCLCPLKKRKSVNKILLNESMNIIIKKLDIFNIFINICLIEYANTYLNKIEEIKMSQESSKNLSEIIL